MALTVGDLMPTIKKLVDSYLQEIGSTDVQQELYIKTYINNALTKLAHIAYQQKDSDVLTISGDGYITFKKSGSDITNMYSPLRIIGPSGYAIMKRVAFEDTKGWWRESSNTPIHIKGLAYPVNPLPSGEYVLQYIAYPATVGSLASPVEFPDAGSMGLCYYTAALILESLTDGQEMASRFYEISNTHLKVAVQANIDARGQSSGGYVPSLAMVDLAFKG